MSHGNACTTLYEYKMYLFSIVYSFVVLLKDNYCLLRLQNESAYRSAVGFALGGHVQMRLCL